MYSATLISQIASSLQHLVPGPISYGFDEYGVVRALSPLGSTDRSLILIQPLRVSTDNATTRVGIDEARPG